MKRPIRGDRHQLRKSVQSNVVTEEEIKDEFQKLKSTILVFNYIKELESYVKFLTDELDELAPIAHVHGWRSTRTEEGENRRIRIRATKKLL